MQFLFNHNCCLPKYPFYSMSNSGRGYRLMEIIYISYNIMKITQVPYNKVVEAINGSCLQCSDFHSGSCYSLFTPHFIQTAKNMYKMYLPIHVVPFLLFKRKKLLKNPKQQLQKLVTGFLNSILFSSSYTGLLTVLLCLMKRIVGDCKGHLIIPPAAFLSGVALWFQNEARRQEISLFLVPKVMESLYLLAKRRKIVTSLKGIEILLMGVAMAIIGYFYQEQPQNIKPSYYSAFQLSLGSV